MGFDELVLEAGRSLGVELALHDGATRLTIDGMDVSVLEIADLEAVVLNGVIGEPPPQGLAPLYRAMLEANFNFAGTAGATLAVNPENGELTLTRVAPLACLGVEAFLSLLEGFVNVLETWRKIVADYRPSEPSGPPSGAALGGGFLQV